MTYKKGSKSTQKYFPPFLFKKFSETTSLCFRVKRLISDYVKMTQSNFSGNSYARSHTILALNSKVPCIRRKSLIVFERSDIYACELTQHAVELLLKDLKISFYKMALPYTVISTEKSTE